MILWFHESICVFACVPIGKVSSASLLAGPRKSELQQPLRQDTELSNSQEQKPKYKYHKYQDIVLLFMIKIKLIFRNTCIWIPAEYQLPGHAERSGGLVFQNKIFPVNINHKWENILSKGKQFYISKAYVVSSNSYFSQSIWVSFRTYIFIYTSLRMTFIGLPFILKSSYFFLDLV